MIGREAVAIRDLKPTMVLSLNGHPPSVQRSLVIHEFGHALGLEHEHQRSDFWDVLEKHFDKDKMMKDPRLQGFKSEDTRKAAFGRDWFKRSDDSDWRVKSEYDPHSIMHYWWVTSTCIYQCIFK